MDFLWQLISGQWRPAHFLSQRGHIQDNLVHQRVSKGPNRFVCHSMYAGAILFMICVPIVPGSWWALVTGGLVISLYVIRTVVGDRTLINNLPGYLQYSEQVRYRLVPGIW